MDDISSSIANGAGADPRANQAWAAPVRPNRAWRRRRVAPTGLQAALTAEWRERFARGLVLAPPGWRDDPRLCRYRLAGEPLADMVSPDTDLDRVAEIDEALAVAAAHGDEVATRVLLQFVLPILVAASRGGLSRAASPGEEGDALDAMISTAWLALATGSAFGGEGGVWRRLVRVAEYAVLQQPRRQRARDVAAALRAADTAGSVADITGRPEECPPAPVEELLEVVCDAVSSGLSLPDAQLLADLGVEGIPVTERARVDAEGVSARCIRYRRAAALRRVRELTVAAA